MTALRAGMGGAILGGAIAVAMALGVSSSAIARTEPISIVHEADLIAFTVPSSELQSAPHRTKGITFNESGDLEVRYRDVTMAMVNNPPEDNQSSQGRPRTTQKQDIPAVIGIIIRVSMGF